MCGRYTQTHADERELKKRFRLKKIPKKLQPRYNVAPRQEVPAILNETPEELSMVRWGLVPGWAEKPKMKFSLINARAEGIENKGIYRNLIRRKRCLIIADSFYEWKKAGRMRQPYRITLKGGGLFAFAGLWDHWERDGNEIASCTIITTDANKAVRKIHDRMPVVLPREKEKDWLADIPLKEVLALLRPLDAGLTAIYPVSLLVNSPSNDMPELIKRHNTGSPDPVLL